MRQSSDQQVSCVSILDEAKPTSRSEVHHSGQRSLMKETTESFVNRSNVPLPVSFGPGIWNRESDPEMTGKDSADKSALDLLSNNSQLIEADGETSEPSATR